MHFLVGKTVTLWILPVGMAQQLRLGPYVLDTSSKISTASHTLPLETRLSSHPINTQWYTRNYYPEILEKEFTAHSSHKPAAGREGRGQKGSEQHMDNLPRSIY
jgi:hypothetical protein